MTKANRFIVIISVLIVSAFFIKATQQNEKPKVDINDGSSRIVNKPTRTSYEIKALKMPSSMSFAGENVPLNIQDVYERMDRELLVNTYWQSNALLYFKRANKFFPTIEKILVENEVPNDFKYLALIESGLMNVTSPAGAKGFWQIMKTTGRENGLEINKNVDERFHLEKSTRVACKYLKNAHKRFGSWTAAAAAYNGGVTGISRQMKKQKVTNYYDLLLGNETSRYVFRIIAAKEILTHPKKYGFTFDKDDLYTKKETYTIEVDSIITNIADFSKYYGMNYKEFKSLNPWLRENTLNNASHKKYKISLPVN